MDAAKMTPPTGTSRLGWEDACVIVVYFIFVLAVGLWSSHKSSRDSVSGYFMASRNMHWILVGSSLFASNIGSGHFIGLAGAGASSGIAAAGFELTSVYSIMMLGWLFVPVYMSSGIYTMPEYLRERFGGQRIRTYLSFLALMLYIFTKISADLYSGALFIQLTLNKTSTEWLYISILILLGIAAVFTISGGLTAVIWTDFVQIVLMLIGAFILMGITFSKVGGYTKLVEDYQYAIASKTVVDLNNNTCGIPPPYYMSMLRSNVPGEADLPWVGMVFGTRFTSLWYWCMDQVTVQRSLASKNMSHAKGSCIFASYLKFLPLWLMVFPGMAARVLFPDRVGCSDPEECLKICGSANGCSNIAYAELVLNLLPPGLAGLMLAVMMAALMSSLTSIFNSASTIFTIDVWKLFRRKFQHKNPTDSELLIVGRIFTLFLVGVSVIWIPVIQSLGTARLLDYFQSIQSFLAPPICAVYLLAIFWSRTTEPGAFWGLMIGLVIGAIRFVLQFSYIVPPCGSLEPDPRPEFIKMFVGNIHYLNFGIILWFITTCITVGISLVTEPIGEEYLYRLTWWSRKSKGVRKKLSDEYEEGTEEDKEKFVEPNHDAPNGDAANGRTTDMEVMEIQFQQPDVPKWKQVFSTVCGSNGDDEKGPVEDPRTEEQKASDAAEFLDEEPKWKKFVDINAIICLSICTGLWAFYA